MILNKKKINSKTLYILFIFLSLIIFFFSTDKAHGKAFDINNIEISRPFEINFDKNEVIEEGFRVAFTKLVTLTVSSANQEKISSVKLNEIKSMIESFSIKEEKFVNEIYYLNLGVSFNKKSFFNYLEKNNIFPSIPVEKKFFFIPVIIDEDQKELLIFSKNKIFDYWNNLDKETYLIKYILPAEDLEDLNLIKKQFDNIERYDFKQVVNKYDLEDSIIALIFKSSTQIRILSRISIKDNVVLKNQSFNNFDIESDEKVFKIIEELKNTYEDYWKNFNQINTSIKLSLNIKIDSSDNLKISNFEKVLNDMDLIYDFNIVKFNNEFIYYKIIFNGTPSNFLKSMNNKNFSINTQNKIWILQ